MKSGHITKIALMLAIAVSAKAQAPRTSAPIDKLDTAERLAEEVRNKGWIVFCARSDKGDWDLFLCASERIRLVEI